MRERPFPAPRRLRRLAADRRAGTAIEYGLILALIVLAMFASLQLVANSTVTMWNTTTTKISNATGN